MIRSRFEELALSDYTLPEDVVARTLSPAFVVYMDRVRENVRRMIAIVGGVERWRPHLKTTKIPEVWAELIAAGVRNFKCATTREARLLCELFDRVGVADADVLVAYPLVGPALNVLGQIATAHPRTRVSVLCEASELVASIPTSVSVFVDVNPGMHRTGIPLDERAAINAVATGAGERFRGIHFYDGHLHQADPSERRAAIFACHDGLMALRADLIAAGHGVRELVTSGTPAFLDALAYPGFEGLEHSIHRVSPGTVVFYDLRSEQDNPSLDLLPAACVLARVVSHPADGIVTCDAGSKSIAAESGDPVAFVLGHPGATPLTPNEEHLPIRWDGERPARGATLLLIPQHVCPTTNLAEQALVVDGGTVRLVAVSARAHDV